MTLTNGASVYASLHERGLNTLINNAYSFRSHYFHYAVPPLGSGTPGVDFLVLPPLPVPPGGHGLAYSIDLSPPVIDMAPQNAGAFLPPPLTLGPNQFSLFIEKVQICVLCGFRVPLSGQQQRDHNRRHHSRGRGREVPELVCASLEVWVVGHPTRVPLGTTDTLLGLEADKIVVKEVCALEPVLECLAKDMVNSLLEQLTLTLTRITLGALPAGLVLTNGPEISEDQLKVWATIV